MGELGTILSRPSAGQTDENGEREFIVTGSAGSKGSVYWTRKNNPLYTPASPKPKKGIESEWYVALITQLRQARQTKGLTQKQLAKLLKTRQSAISQFENNHTNPSLRFLIKYAKALGATLTFNVTI